MADQVPRCVVLLFSVFLWVQTSHGATSKQTMAGDSLKPGDILNHTTQLCSATNVFCMDFDRMNDDSDFTYLRIFYVTQRVIVWIGNGNEPVVNNSGALTLDHNGSLKVIPKVEEGKPIKVLYSPSQPTNNTVATLHDNGNFVLQELHTNGSTKITLWQSFDYPTDKLVPGVNSAVDEKTDQNQASCDFRELPRRFLFMDKDQKIKITRRVLRPGGGPYGTSSEDHYRPDHPEEKSEKQGSKQRKR